MFLSIKERKTTATHTNEENMEEDASSPILPPPEPEKPLNIVMSSSFKDGNNKWMKQYHTRGQNRGLMVIFYYSVFLTGPENRDIESDCVLLKDLFSAFHFKVVIHSNLDKKDTLETLKKLPTEGFESVFIVVSSHGFERKGQWDTEFHCGLGGVSTFEVVELFSNENRPELRGIPKVFVFQMCRGSKELTEVENVAKDTAVFTEESDTSQARVGHRKFSDILIAHSTLPGHESILNEKGVPGSLYMQALCEVFGSLAHERHVLDLFRILDARFKELCPAATTSVDCWGFADLYLNPGLMEDADGNPTPMK